MRWQRKLPSMDFGAATVANDVVFTSTFDGTIYAFETTTGKTLWTTKAPAGINSFPAVDGDTLLVGAGAAGPAMKHPSNELDRLLDPVASPRKADSARPLYRHCVNASPSSREREFSDSAGDRQSECCPTLPCVW